MKQLMIFLLLSICIISCQEKEEQYSNKQQKKYTEMDSVMIQPIDINNTVFMMHFRVNSLVDSVFLAPPNKMEDIYKDLIFELNIIISDIQKMDFQFEGSEKLIQSIEKLMLKHKDMMNKFPSIMKIQQSKELTNKEKKKVQNFDDEYNAEIIPLEKEFLEAQEEFAKKHKIELVDY